MKDVGIVTFHRSYNYGSVLQAYALQHYINKNLLKTVDIIDFIMKKDFEQYYLFRISSYKKYKKNILSDIYFLKKNLKRKRSFEKFIKKYLLLSKNTYYKLEDIKEVNKEYDSFICGSDQIWNLKCTKGIEPIYFLGFADNTKKKIAYAPSIAQVNLNKKQVQDMKKYIEKLDFLSVREEETVNIISGLTDKEVHVVLDPTLLLDGKEYEELIDKIDEQDYIFIYVLEKNDEVERYAVEVAKRFKLKVVYLNKKNLSIDIENKNVYGCSPNEFLGYIRGARFVITNSFHATVFSILFRKKFCTFRTEHSYWRMVNLLEKLELKNRLHDLNRDINSDIDYIIVEKKLEVLRKKSQEYLKESLG